MLIDELEVGMETTASIRATGDDENEDLPLKEPPTWTTEFESEDDSAIAFTVSDDDRSATIVGIRPCVFTITVRAGGLSVSHRITVVTRTATRLALDFSEPKKRAA